MSERTMWAVDAWLPDYPYEIADTDDLNDLYMIAGEHSKITLYSVKREALEAAEQAIQRRIRTMHDEGMEDTEYDRSREWADALISAIQYELRTGEKPDFKEIAADLKTARRERGEW